VVALAPLVVVVAAENDAGPCRVQATEEAEATLELPKASRKVTEKLAATPAVAEDKPLPREEQVEAEAGPGTTVRVAVARASVVLPPPLLNTDTTNVPVRVGVKTIA